MRIIDMHCDTISRLMESSLELRENPFHMDLHKMKEAGYLLQNFALFVNMTKVESPLETGLLMADCFYREMEKNKDLIRPVTTYEEIMKNKEEGLMSALLTLEEGEICKGNPAILRDFYRLGVRMITLTWNHKNSIGCSNSQAVQPYGTSNPEGLTENGLSFIEEMERLGVIIDVSHLSDGGFYDVYEHTTRPFVASHSNARTVCPHCRNLTDDMIRKMGERGCVTGLNYYGAFVNPGGYEAKSTVEGIARHARHIADLGGIQCVGLGSDFDGFAGECDMKDCSQMNLLEDALKKQGFTSSDVDKIFYENVLSLYKEILSK